MKYEVILSLIGVRGGERRERVVRGRTFRPQFYSRGNGHDINVNTDSIVYNESDADIVSNHTRPIRSTTGVLGQLLRDIQVTVPLRKGAAVRLTPQFKGRFVYGGRKYVEANIIVEQQ